MPLSLLTDTRRASLYQNSRMFLSFCLLVDDRGFVIDLGFCMSGTCEHDLLSFGGISHTECVHYAIDFVYIIPLLHMRQKLADTTYTC